MSVNSTSPSTLFGGTWVALNEGRVLIGAGTAYPAGSTGGEATHKLTTKEMPSHSHSGSTSSDGSHSHTRGSMNITGTVNESGNQWHGASGAFELNPSGSAYTHFNPHVGNLGFNFDASRNWSGSTSSNGSHSHTMSLNNTGGGSAHNNMQPYLSVYMWKRTA